MRDLTTQLRRQRKIQGFVYTELTDIEWEHNGLVNYDRTPKGFGYDTWLPDMRPNELLGADFIGYDAPPAIVGKPGETITVPIFVSHFSDRPGSSQAAMVGQRLRSARRHPDASSSRTSIPITWRPYDVVDLEPLRVTLPDYPFVGALATDAARPSTNQRFAANFVNLVVKPDRPLPRIERRGPNDVDRPVRAGRLRQPAMVRAGQGAGRARSTGMARAIFEYRIAAPRRGRQGPSRVDLLPVRGGLQGQARAGRLARAGQPPGLSPDRRGAHLAVDAGSCRSTVGPIERIDLPDDAADARGVLSHLAGVEHGSHGELVDGLIALN